MIDSLRFRDKKFKILVCSDLYESANQSKHINELKSKDTALFLDASIKALDPDLVVFNGDCAFGDDEISLREATDRITKTVRERDIPFAVVFGDEENDGQDIAQLRSIYSEYENCLFNLDSDKVSDNSDHYALIHDENGVAKFNLWFFNSNGSTSQKDVSSKYDWVHDEQIERYEKIANELKENGVKKSIVFQHIPVVDEYRLMREAAAYEVPKAVKGSGFFSDRLYLPSEPLYGNYRDPIECSDFNNGQFDSWKRTGDVKAAFFSNSHLNDFEGYLDKILLAQCCATGFKGCHDGDRVGVKLITIDERDLSFKTKNWYFSDFGLKAQSVLPIDSKLSQKQKKNIAIAGAAGAVIGASMMLVSRLFKKKK